jgi:DNA-binding transcriptional LysR family regulator
MRRARTRRAVSELDREKAGKGPPSAIDKTNIPTDLLRTFVTIHELGSFTKTAQLLELTQPAVSAQMKRLESLLGADLLEKNLLGVRLTECGLEVLRLGRRVLSINDQIVSSGGQQPGPQSIRIGIPNIFAPAKLAGILTECRGKAGASRLQICCEHSKGLLRGVRSGYLDMIFMLGSNEDLQDALTTWSEDLVWVRSPDFVLEPDAVVPLVSSPNVLLPDRMAMVALEQANRRYEIVFTAFDTLARRAAAAAGLGYFPMARSLVSGPLVIEEPGVLPPLPTATMGIIVREDFDTTGFAPLISAFKSVLMSDVAIDKMRPS